MSLKTDLEQVIRGEISDNLVERERVSTDASLFTVIPELVVAPLDAADLASLVRFVAKKKFNHPNLSLTARAAGTCMSGGSLNESIIIDCVKHLNRLGEVDLEAKMITAEPGVYYREMEKKTLPHHLVMPAYTASKDLAAVGGMVANNAGGEKSLVYGSTERYVKELGVVLADGEEYRLRPLNQEQLAEKEKQNNFEGEVYHALHQLLEDNYDLLQAAKPRVSKNSSGYFLWNVWDRRTFDLTRLFSGSQGTLGLITSITFGLVPLKAERRLLAITLPDFRRLPQVIETVLRFQPETFECFDDQTFRLAEKYLPEVTKKLTGVNSQTVLTLIAEFTGNEAALVASTARAAAAALENLAARELIEEPEAIESYWRVRRASFRLLHDHSGNSERVAPFIDDIIVPPEKLAEFFPALRQILERFQLTYTLAGHIGDGNFHLIPLIDLSQPKTAIPNIIGLSEAVFDLVFAAGGSMSGEHNDGLIRTPFLSKMYGPEVYALFGKVKKLFDPQNIFNPGKKVDGTMEQALAKLSPSNHCAHF